MKVFYNALFCSALFRFSSTVADQATYNIDESVDARDELSPLADDQPVNIIFRTSDEITDYMLPMSMSVKKEIGRTGIKPATVSKRDLQQLERSGIIYEFDSKVFVLGHPDSASHLRKLAEETPYGIPMVLENMDFWNGLDAPDGSIKVCVADTGYDYGHEDLPQDDDVTGSNSSNGSWNKDGHGHGTHCSGTVAGLGDNSKGVVGVIPNNMNEKFQLVIGKALTDSGSGSLSGVLEAVQHCVDNGAKVVSLSLGGGGYSSVTNEFYNNLYENEDILFVAAAGNGGSGSKLYPASYPALMSVAAIDSNKNKASFSQYNDQVEISAPGVGVKSSLPDDKYAAWSGTSMATPHVAGVAGLLWMYFPDCKNYQIRNVLAATAKDLGTDGCDISYGYGLVQAKKAYELLSQGNCGGEIGEDTPKGGCEQLYPEPNCDKNSDCDDGDECTVDTCDNGQCISTPNCASCGKSKVDVEITIDNYGEETAYNIKDSSGQEVMKGSGWPSNSVNSFWKCLSSGGYSFTITDGYGDGLCCSYGNGGYSVKVNDEEVASGGQFSSEETKSFNVGTTAPVSPPTPAPVEQTFAPTTSVSEEEQTFAPTTSVSEEEQTFAPTTSVSEEEQTFAPTTSVSEEEQTFAPTTSVSEEEQTSAPTEEEQTFAPTTSVSEEEQTSAPTEEEQTFAPTTSVSEEEQTSAPTTSVSEEVVFPPTSTSSKAPTTPNPDTIMPTPYPTGTAPTPYPTDVPLTSSPTETPPTPYPTDSPPTPSPTQTAPTPYPTQVAPTDFPTITPPTMHPTDTPPTMNPTDTPPTAFPTQTAPTPFPTETPPTSSPTSGCKLKGEECSKGSDCCEKKCKKNGTCKK